MSDETPPLKAKLNQLTHTLTSTSPRRHLQSLLVSLGLVLVGVSLGVKWAAVKTLAHVQCGPLTQNCITLAPIYNNMTQTTLLAGGLCIVGGLYLIQHGEDTDDSA